MSTSANATEVAVNYQWNDLYTQVGNRTSTPASSRPSPRRRGPAGQAWLQRVPRPDVIGYVYPWKGRDASGDRVIKELKRITCVGAQGGTGINGRTRIRIAQDAIIDDRGIKIAQILRTKWENGCNIRIVYALMGNRSRASCGTPRAGRSRSGRSSATGTTTASTTATCTPSRWR